MKPHGISTKIRYYKGVFAFMLIFIAPVCIIIFLTFPCILTSDTFWNALGVISSIAFGVITYRLSKQLADIEKNREIAEHRPSLIIKSCTRKSICFNQKRKCFEGTTAPEFTPQSPCLTSYNDTETLYIHLLNVSKCFCKVHLHAFTIASAQEDSANNYHYGFSHIPNKNHDLFLTEQDESAFCFVLPKNSIEKLYGSLCTLEVNLTNAIGEVYRQKFEFNIVYCMADYVQIGLREYELPYRIGR